MPELTHLPADAPIDEIMAVLDRDGALILDDVVAPHAVDGVGVRATFEAELWPAERQRRTLAALLRPLLAPHFDTRTA